jgi:putative flippase GtrA
MNGAGFGARGAKLAIVGAACFCLNVALVWIGDRAGLHYLAAAMLAFPAVLIVGYLLHARFTFGEPLSLASFLPYAAAMGCNLPLSGALLVVLCEVFGVGAPMGMALAAILLIGWNLLSPVVAFRLGRTVRPGAAG